MNKEKQGKKLRFNLKSNPIMGVLIPLIFIMLVTQIFNFTSAAVCGIWSTAVQS